MSLTRDREPVEVWMNGGWLTTQRYIIHRGRIRRWLTHLHPDGSERMVPPDNWRKVKT